MSSYAPFDSPFAHSVAYEKYMGPHGETHWSQLARRVTDAPLSTFDARGIDSSAAKERLYPLINGRYFIPGGRYLYAAGNDYHQVQNCLLLDVEDTREGWADLSHKTFMALMSGAGIGVYYGKLRERGALIRRTGGTATGPVPLAVAINEQSRAAVQGGNRRSAIWAGLIWNHPDIFEFIKAKDWPDYIREAKERDPYNTPAPLDMTNISVCLDDDFFAAYGDPSDPQHDLAQRVYWATVDMMTQTGEPGFSVDLGSQRNEKLRNACTEITSADDSDICNLGGLVLPRFDSPQQFENAVREGVLYLLAGTLYSDVPYEKVAEVREKNRRLGLDLMGIHEFLLQRGLAYGSDEGFEALEPYMKRYDRALEFAHDWAEKLGITPPVGATAGSPTGTRGVVAETTTSWQTVTYTSYIRNVLNSAAGQNVNRAEYVIDPTVARLIREGYIHRDDKVEDSVDLAQDYERVFKMQAYAQSHTDHAISMTVNLPHVMRDPVERRQFGETLIRYLPRLRGMTVYPDGAIPGQPIKRVSMQEAIDNGAVAFESEDKCVGGSCGV